MAAIRLNVSIPHTLHADSDTAPTAALYLPAVQLVHADAPTSEYMPAGHKVESVAPARACCVTGPVAVHVVEASMTPSYTEW